MAAQLLRLCRKFRHSRPDLVISQTRAGSLDEQRVQTHREGKQRVRSLARLDLLKGAPPQREPPGVRPIHVREGTEQLPCMLPSRPRGRACHEEAKGCDMGGTIEGRGGRLRRCVKLAGVVEQL